MLTHWGHEWLEKRIEAVGYRSLISFAKAVGCTVQHLTKLIDTAAPPRKFRRGLDAALCQRLGVDQVTLFVNWAEIPPESIPVAAPGNESKLREEIAAAASLLNGQKLLALNSIAKTLVSGNP